MTGRKIILFELNEVPRRIWDIYANAHPNSVIARLRRETDAYETFTPDTGHLSPWVTWPTLHRGVLDQMHGICHLNQPTDEADKNFLPIWSLLARNGVRVGMGGSLHSSPLPKDLSNYDFYLPDTFAATKDAHPPALSVFQNFNIRMVSRSGRNVDTGVDWRSALGLLGTSIELGIRPETYAELASQLVAERVNPAIKHRRRTHQSNIAFDIFAKSLASKQPDFATFFTNHVASSMHRFWAAAFPDEYEDLQYDAGWIKQFRDEIMVAMGCADRYLGRLLKFVDLHPEYLMLIATSMGQAANSGTPHFCEVTVRFMEKFMTRMGLPPGTYSSKPAMAPVYAFVVDGEYADQFEANLSRLCIGQNRQPVDYSRKVGNFFTFMFGQPNMDERVDHLYFGNEEVEFTDAGLENVAQDFQQGSTGYHVPEGILMVYDPKARRSDGWHAGQVSTTDIAPSILRAFNQPVPSYMSKGNLLAA